MTAFKRALVPLPSPYMAYLSSWSKAVLNWGPEIIYGLCYVVIPSTVKLYIFLPAAEHVSLTLKFFPLPPRRVLPAWLVGWPIVITGVATNKLSRRSGILTRARKT